MLLSKSDYIIATSCPKKLLYKKRSYMTANDTDEYFNFLAEGGHIIGKLAQLYYPDGIEISASTMQDAIEESKALIRERENVILFESTFSHDNKVARIDILEKKGNVLNLIEVKSKSFDSNNEIKSKKELKDSIEDVAYQTMILQSAYPDCNVNSYLLLPEKSRRTGIDRLPGWFRVDDSIDEIFDIEELPARSSTQYKRHRVVFKYDEDPNREDYITQLKSDNILILVEVTSEVEEVINDVKENADLFIEILNRGITESDYSINKHCKDCEFNLGIETQRNGFRECWGELADVEPHIFELYSGGSIGSKNNWYLDELITGRKVAFNDLDVNRFKTKEGIFGANGKRQKLQVEKTLSNEEWINESLSAELNQLQYPLHFIDFETYHSAIPPFIGMRPYEKVAFQWSCHTIESAESEPIHSEWLNCDYEFPNFQFAESLMEQIGERGTPLMWSHYENTTLKDILEQFAIRDYSNDDLNKWLTEITKDKGREGRFVDLRDFCLKYYFHPMMKGKTSIKKVLPAVMSNTEFVESIPWIGDFVRSNSPGTINPYDDLSSEIEGMESEEFVNDGTGAMKAYYEIMFGSLSEDQTKRITVKQNLLKYCKLDSLAMVIIWKYWINRSGSQ